MIILSKQFPHEGQAFEIFVKYDQVEMRPVEVKCINIQLHGRWYPIGSLMTRFFKDAVWRLIMEIDWEQVRIEKENAPTLADFIHPIFQIAASPFLVTGGEVKEIYN